MTVNLEVKRKQEQQVISKMILIYCRGKHKSKQLCEECQQLLDYATEKIEKCPMMAEKTFCSGCEIHCYQAEKREQIKQVMRYAGPRIIFHHPILLIKHVMDGKKGRKEK